jgi:hypothetical protein
VFWNPLASVTRTKSEELHWDAIKCSDIPRRNSPTSKGSCTLIGAAAFYRKVSLRANHDSLIGTFRSSIRLRNWRLMLLHAAAQYPDKIRWGTVGRSVNWDEIADRFDPTKVNT